ncbi:MAG: acyl-CoA thioesterase [Saprospiraceae bacterium]|nr:acyl-CoA thioesterase [Saprospiraceae bacterium]
MEPKLVSTSRSVMTEMIMPNDTNPLHHLMGGNLMRWMDIIGGICAGKHCESHVVTASVDHVSFHEGIEVGEVITLTAQVTRAFNTSVETFVEVHVADIKGHNSRKSNHAYFTFVAVDEKNHRPQKVPGVIPENPEEEKLFESAQRRREVRLVLAGRIKPEEASELIDYFSAFDE